MTQLRWYDEVYGYELWESKPINTWYATYWICKEPNQTHNPVPQNWVIM